MKNQYFSVLVFHLRREGIVNLSFNPLYINVLLLFLFVELRFSDYFLLSQKLVKSYNISSSNLQLFITIKNKQKNRLYQIDQRKTGILLN
jgi:hypothetical protein